MILRHICENCDKTEDLTPDEGFEQGWDYPPRLGEFRTLSPRTCGDCGIDTTLWWRVAVSHESDPMNLSEAEQVLLTRILGEPASITISDEESP